MMMMMMIIIIIIILFVSMDLAEHSSFTNWEDYKSNWITTNQINCCFLVRGENRSSRRKTSQNRVEYQQTQSAYDCVSANKTRAVYVLVEDECSHHCANPCEG